MIINESGLTRQIKRAYSHGGYTVAHTEEGLAVYTDMWFIMCATKIMPRKALAAIVEHTGTLPERGRALVIKKDVDPQSVDKENVENTIQEWISANETKDVTMTLLTYKGLQIFQAEAEDNLNCYGASQSALEIMEYEACRYRKAVAADRYKLSWYDDGTQVVIRAYSGLFHKKDQNLWNMLESIDLKPKDETEE